MRRRRSRRGDGDVLFYRMVQAFPATLLTVLDAAGLALFAVAGTEKALDYKVHPFMAALLGTITGVGGGTIRDVFLAQAPRVLQSDIYATAGGGGGADCCAEGWRFSDGGRVCRRRMLLCVARGGSDVELKFAENCGVGVYGWPATSGRVRRRRKKKGAEGACSLRDIWVVVSRLGLQRRRSFLEARD